MRNSINKEFFKRDTVKVARDLIGKMIIYNGMSGIIVETEAYKGYPDEASHAAKRTPRSAIMFDTYGRFYVYFVYGNYHCVNITTEDGKPGAVLIRAVEPVKGIELMCKNRKVILLNKNLKELHKLASGPGKLCRAFGITKELNGTAVGDKIKVVDDKAIRKKTKIVSTFRVGIKKAKHLKWRFYLKGSPYVSRA